MQVEFETIGGRCQLVLTKNSTTRRFVEIIEVKDPDTQRRLKQALANMKEVPYGWH